MSKVVLDFNRIEPLYYRGNSWFLLSIGKYFGRCGESAHQTGLFQDQRDVIIMGAKAEGAAQGFTVLGGIVCAILAFLQLSAGINGAIGGDMNAILDVVLAIALIIMVLLSFDACGFIYWKVQKSGILLTIFGFAAMIILARGLTFDILTWLTALLPAFMIFLAGLLLLLKS
jgi:hypothetical protein